jgi:hypothetical protein
MSMSESGAIALGGATTGPSHEIVALRREHTEQGFRCSQVELAEFLRDDAWKSE